MRETRMRGLLIAGAAALTLGGCAYRAETGITPANTMVTSFSQKVPGRWLAYVEADRLTDSARVVGMQCSAHTFPLDFRTGFPASVRDTLPNVLESVETINSPAGGDAAANKGNRGVITIRGESVRGRIIPIDRFMTIDLQTEVDITATVTVDGPRGRLFGRTIDGRGRGEGPAGFACGGGAEALKRAAEDAQRDLLRRIGEEIANADRVRSAGR